MMSNILSKSVIFAAGAVVGSAVTYFIVKGKFERMAQEEIEAVRDFYINENKKTEDDSSETEEEEPKKPTAREVYAEVVNDLGYDHVSDEKIKEEEEDDDVSEPYVISPSEYGELNYEQESLWYYEGDGVVTTYFGEIVEDVDDLVGDFIPHFGEYEEDSVHVRNDKLKTDFEILRDLGSSTEK